MPDRPSLLTLNFLFLFCFCSVEGVKYKDRACCEIGSNFPSETCSLPDEMDTIDTIRIAVLVGSAMAVLCIICCFGWVFYKCYKQVVQPTNAPKKVTLVSAPSTPAAVIPSTNTLPVGSVVSSSYVIPGNNAQVAYGGVNAVMRPSAPMNPAFYARN
mmetsp:Transcript_21625/g.33453  ORF Transcript_21625/g.33453 Transcript_21625/m.33453 type:complete len:157 (-) Transcript_21625:1770-2240(-)